MRRRDRCPCATDPGGPCESCDQKAEERSRRYAEWNLDGLDDLAEYAAAKEYGGGHP